MYRLLALVCLISTLTAVEKLPPIVIDQPISPPRIEVGKNEQAVRLDALDVDIHIAGLFAETTQTMVFVNPNNRALEGTLIMPLPEGGTVCAYALDINGQMVDGVIVPKQKARQILEAEERRGVDPGIVEKVVGTIYRTRIYPIPAHGKRTIRITYTSPLILEGNNAAYHLPLPHKQQLKHVRVHIDVQQSTHQPQLSGLGNLHLRKWQQGWTAETTLSNSALTDDLLIQLPVPSDQPFYKEQTPNGEIFIAITEQRLKTNKSFTPQRLALYWDASSSINNATKTLSALEEYFKLFTGQGPTIDLVVIRDQQEQPLIFTHSAQLLKHLRTLVYDGGSALNSLDFRDHALPHPDDECILLISDGIDSMGTTTFPHTGSKPVYTISSQAHANHAFLRYIANKSGGQHMNLLTTPSHLVSTALSQKYYASNASAYIQHMRNSHQLLINNHIVTIGKVTNPAAFSEQQVSEQSLIARIWAQQEAQQLEINAAANANKLLQLGRKYNIVTASTSLLVLESLDQYLRYDVEPPATLPAIRSQWQKNRRQTATDEQARLHQKIETVVGWWNERLQWWNTTFTVPTGWRWNDGGEKKARRTSREDRAIATTVAPSLMQAAPNFQEGTMDGDREAEEIVDSIASGTSSKSISNNGRQTAARINITAWNPKTPYIAAMKADDRNAYTIYLQQRPSYQESPSFYLDCADYLISLGHTSLGLRVLSNLSEMGLDDAALKRVHAWRLQQADALDRAIILLESVCADRPDEPQSHRDLALALANRGSAHDRARAKSLLWNVITGHWDRFPQIEIIALVELNQLLAQDGIIPSYIDTRLLKNTDVDVRISLSWDADLTDVDLHVFEPTGEHAYYSHNRTRMGGLVSRDFTGGYGPEEYLVKKAVPGTYQIKVHYYGSRQQTLIGPATVTATVYTNYGRPNQSQQVLTLRLDTVKDMVLVGEVNIGANQIGYTHTTDNIDTHTLQRITHGMTIPEVTAILGQPTRINGKNGNTILVYIVGTNTYHIILKESVISVKHIFDGAEKELLE